MRAIHVVIVLTVCGGLAGCQAPTEQAQAPALCAAGTNDKDVSIQILYDDKGVPRAEPASCTVTSEKKVTWQTADGEKRCFELVFKQGQPGEDAGSGGKDCDKKIKMKKVDAETAFPYGIRANGHVVDPEIIIKPN